MTFSFSLFRPLHRKDRFQPKVEVTRRLAMNMRFVIEDTTDETRACEYLFDATNASADALDSEQRWIAERFICMQEHSISVGDVLIINNSAYLCKNIGWEKIENFIANYDEN